MLHKKCIYSVISVIMAVVMVVLSALSPVGAIGDIIADDEATLNPGTNNADKIDPALKEKMAEASPDEKIPVAIWYEDIDQEQVDELTTQKVGFSQEEVALDYEMPSTALLNDLEAEKDGADAELEAYMERTKLQRESERKRTDEYIMTRREFSRAKYNEKSANIIKDLSLNESDITFNSQYAPMIIAELTSSEINVIEKKFTIDSISYYEHKEPESMSIETAIETTGVNMVNESSALGLTGKISEDEPVKVGLIERHAPLVTDYDESGYYIIPDNSVPEIYEITDGLSMTDYGNIVIVGNTTYDPDYEKKEHADGVIDTLLSVAPEVKIYCSNTEYKNIEAMISAGVQILSHSLGKDVSEIMPWYDYETDERWYDHIIATHGITVLVAAGNNGECSEDVIDSETGSIIKYGARVTSPGMAYNVITVGAYCNDLDDGNEETYYPNEFYGYTSYKNAVTHYGRKNIGCEKPDVIAPATFGRGGTSNATPFVAGMVALMYELKPSLAAAPQAIKAIVLASCHKKMIQHSDDGVQEFIEDGITERQGAGAPNAFIMASIISQGTYGVGRISATATQGVRRFMLPSTIETNGASNLNVSVTWLKENIVNDGLSHNSIANISYGDNVNLDLYVYRNNQLAGISKIGSVDENDDRISSTEMAYMQLNHSEWNYEIRIQKAESYDKVVRYGYAYSTDKPCVSYESGDEGIYYIRNYVTDKYLTLNDNNEAVMENFTGETNQQWVVSGESGDYEILPAYGELGKKINYGAQVGINPYYKAILGTSDLNLSITSWETDTTLEPDAHIFTSSGANENNILSYTYSTGIFVRSTTDPVVNMYRMWVLEDINFKVGDVNCNGKIGIPDATMIQKYLAGVIDINNINYYLADYNNDGSVDIQDSTAIQQYVAGIL